MTLTLRIENFDTLDDGGPTWITLDQRGASIGRRSSMDWVLPDPGNHISGHHFDISFSDGFYWLTDVSTNGTFMADSHYRIEGAVRLLGGERLIVGHYVIYVDLEGSAAAAPRALPDATWPGLPTEDDPWNIVPKPLEPVNPLPPPTFSPHHFDDVAYDFVPLQRPDPMPAVQRPIPAHPAAQPAPRPARNGQAMPAPQPPAPQGPHADDVLQAFLRGARLSPDAARKANPVELAEALGEAVRISTEHIMAMLRDRATVKHNLRTADRTMTSHSGNNPMKFLDTVDEALVALFLHPREGFTRGAESYDVALRDLRAHQAALVAAMQPALAELLRGLSPEEILDADSQGGNFLRGFKKSRNWDAFVAKWDAKASEGNHGMLDVYLKAFIKVYSAAAEQYR